MSPVVPRARHRVRDLLLVGLAAGIGALAVTGYATYRIWAEAGRDDARRAGAIVVLGAAQYDGRPSPVFAARLDHAIELYQAGYAPLLVMTGGKQAGDRWTEAEAARRYAIAKGVPASAIAVESHGRTTLESLDAVAAILRERGVTDAVFVSDPTHMLRVLRIAEDTGLTAYGSPTRTSPVDRDTTSRAEATIHELGALALYFVARSAPSGELASARAPAAADGRWTGPMHRARRRSPEPCRALLEPASRSALSPLGVIAEPPYTHRDPSGVRDPAPRFPCAARPTAPASRPPAARERES